MDYVGFIAFVLAILNLSITEEKIKKLKRKIAKFEKPEQGQKGEFDMSNMLEELKGKKCTLETEDDTITGIVTAVDEQWIKAEHTDKKGTKITELIRTDSIEKVTIEETAEA